jgi:hypothetical protein
VKERSGKPLQAGKSTINLVSFHRGHKYVHADIIEAKFCGTDDDGAGKWEIVARHPGGCTPGDSNWHSIDKKILPGAYGPEELREWIDKLRELRNPVWLSGAWFCPIYRTLNVDHLALCLEQQDQVIAYLNEATDHGSAYAGRPPSFEFRLTPRKPTGKPFPHGWDGTALVGFLYDYFSSGRKLQTITKTDFCALTGHDEQTVAALIENGAVPLKGSGRTTFDCMQLAKFLAHAYTNCWNGWKFVWGHQWKIERGSKPNALRIGNEDWYEVNYEARGPGVYLLFKDSKLQYVGESGCVMQRVANHYGDPRWGDFDMALYRPVDPSKRRTMERHYTRELCPQFDPHRYQVCN